MVRPSSLPGHLIELSGRLARWARTAPPGAHALAALHHLDASQLEHLERLADLSHLNSGSRTLTAVISGQLHPFGAATSPPPPRIRLPVPER